MFLTQNFDQDDATKIFFALTVIGNIICKVVYLWQLQGIPLYMIRDGIVDDISKLQDKNIQIMINRSKRHGYLQMVFNNVFQKQWYMDKVVRRSRATTRSSWRSCSRR